jgi:mannose-6-phosphate isomerase
MVRPAPKKTDNIYQSPENLITKEGGFIKPTIVEKPWGQEELIVVTDRYVAKILTIKPGHILSVQYHNHKCETLRCFDGEGWAYLGTKSNPEKLSKKKFTKGMILHITPGMVHTYEGGKKTLKLFEVSTPEIWDVVRIKDKYGRSTPTRK